VALAPGCESSAAGPLAPHTQPNTKRRPEAIRERDRKLNSSILGAKLKGQRGTEVSPRKKPFFFFLLNPGAQEKGRKINPLVSRAIHNTRV
jgi:hypothetical protein